MIDKIKRDSEINWKKAVNFTPKKDEIIIYDFENSSPKVKIGDGIHKVNELDFSESVIKVENHNYKVEKGVLMVE